MKGCGMAKKTIPGTTQGWGKLPASRKWHYFDNSSFSLCGKIGFYLGPLDEGNDDSPDNCAKCKSILKREALRQK
jgi:hypothetical protein